tara:strand:+ start:7940 stop:9604 length:1665 start_codon:yes stop_codon:yes gene_type:complete
MAIKNIHTHFLDIIKNNQKSADELADMFQHELHFNQHQAVDAIYNSTVKTLKSVGIFDKTRVKKRGKGTLEMAAFEITDEDAKHYKELIEENSEFAFRKVFTQKNIKKTYEKYFGLNGASVDKNGTVSFLKGVYGRKTQDDTRARHEAQKDLTVQAVQVVIKNFAPEFKQIIQRKNKDFFMPDGSPEDAERAEKFDNLQEKDAIKTRAVDSHSTQGNDTTTATLNALLNLEQAVDDKIANEVNKVVDKSNIIASSKNRMLAVFSEFKIGKDSITDIVAQRAEGQKVEDKITVTLEYGTDKLNRSMKRKDRDGIEEKLNDIRDDQLDQLARMFINEDKRSAIYRNLKASPKSYDERLEAGALNNTISMVEGVEKISKLLKGVKVTSGRKVKAKKKQTSSKTSKQTVTKSKTKNKKVAKGVARKERILATGRYNKNTTNSSTSLANLMQIINAQLPRFLKRNMTPPRLQYRGKGNPSRPFAGPFNTGVQVTSLTDSKSNAGGVNVHYTYEKYPYQTFEPGFEQGSTLRDPRELIKESIRQIMITNKQNRFLRFRRH